MFSLVHFSRVFPYIHPYLFPIEPTESVQSVVDDARQARPEPGAATFDSATAREASLSTAGSQGRRLKNLYRRRLRSQRNEALTYSGAFRNAAW
jgi:hypothetical protein